MTTQLVAGLLLGLSAGLAPGPMLALVMAQTVAHGAREGIKVALAPLVTDVAIAAVSLVVLAGIRDSGVLFGLISLAGGLYVLYLSWKIMRARPLDVGRGDTQPHSFRKGLLVNLLNPHPYVFWMTVAGPLILGAGRESALRSAAFLSSFYVMLVGSKVGLALVVGRSRDCLKSRAHVWIMRGLACLLAGFGVFLLRDALKYLGLA